MANAAAGPSQPALSIVGLPIGALDPTQPARLLSSPDSKLSFAAFHPLAASHTLQKEQSRSDQLCSGRRVVIETLPTGQNIWRWVPRAKGAEGGSDEGEWPRVVNICGQLVLCSQDQWDIYKLDPQYDCAVLPAPALSTITRRSSNATRASPQKTPSKAKRPYVEDSSDDDLPMPGSIKKTRPPPAEDQRTIDDGDDDFDDSDEEVEMIVESTVDLTAAREARRKKVEENRKKRRARLAKTIEKKTRTAEEAQESHPASIVDATDLSMTDLTIQDTQTTSGTQQPPYSNPPSYDSSARPPSYTSQSPHNASADSAYNNPFTFKRGPESPELPPSKRARRTRSPSSSKHKHAKKSSGRDRWQGKYGERLKKMQEERDRVFVESLRADLPPEWRSTFSSTSSATTDTAPSTPQDIPDTPVSTEDPVSLEEKIRRIQEMNSFERARRERDEAQRRAEAAEAEKQRKHEEALRRERERAERLRQERERDEERRRKELEEEAQRRRRAQEDAERAWREQQQRSQQERYASGPWTALRALERYRLLSDEFDAASFSGARPLEVADVPWPVLVHPARFAIEDVDWAAVEAFFAGVRPHMRAGDYRTFVEKSHRRFHPDRWRARRVLQSVEDDELRACLEVAANTVAQAITPIWREVKSG